MEHALALTLDPHRHACRAADTPTSTLVCPACATHPFSPRRGAPTMHLTASPSRAQAASPSCSLAAASPFVGTQLRAAAPPRQQPRAARRMAGVSCTAAPEATKTQRPDATGRFGRFGGKYVPETLIAALVELEAAYQEAMSDPAFLVRAGRGGEWSRR